MVAGEENPGEDLHDASNACYVDPLTSPVLVQEGTSLCYAAFIALVVARLLYADRPVISNSVACYYTHVEISI